MRNKQLLISFIKCTLKAESKGCKTLLGSEPENKHHRKISFNLHLTQTAH